MSLEIIVSSLYLMTLPSERGPTKMQREIISFLEVSPKALIPLFHCHWMWHWEVLSCPAFSFIARPAACFTLIVMLGSAHLPPCCCATSLTGSQAPGDSFLASASVLHSRHVPPAAQLGKYRGCTNPTLDKPQRKIKKISASVAF